MDDNSEIHKDIAQDEGFQHKRKVLVLTSLLLISLSVSRASILEANTFILRIEFENSFAFTHLAAVACVFLTLRYYGYAQMYHNRLSDFWKRATLHDGRVLRYHAIHIGPEGMLGNIVAEHGINEDGLMPMKYQTKPIFRRSLVILHEMQDPETGQDILYPRSFKLHPPSDHWEARQYLRLVGIEIGHRLSIAFKTRAYLDVHYPYLLSAAALITYLPTLCKLILALE